MTREEAKREMMFAKRNVIADSYIDKAYDMAIKALEDATDKDADTISKKAVEYKLKALVNELEEIFSNIRVRNGDDSVCGLCEYDGAYMGQSGDWCNECPGFEKDDCFVLKEKYRKEWEEINE